MKTPQPERTAFYWEFRGQTAAPTAAHFRKHLDDFLQTHAVPGKETGEVALDPLLSVVWCLAEPPAHALIETVLRPRGSATSADHEAFLASVGQASTP